MRRPLVAGNWKMNGTKEKVSSLIEGITKGLGEGAGTDVVVCPPFVYLDQASALLSGAQVALGAQNLCQIPSAGAFTGEISATMLTDLDCQYAIIGHSERRSLYGESDELVAEKFIAAGNEKLIPIVCVGELLEERESGDTETVVARQLDAILNKEGGASVLEYAVIAYEPVWAIGTGKTATTEQAQEVHQFIRRRIEKKFPDIASTIRILYGGSVNAGNAASLFAMPDIDGGLIGGASLKVDDFLSICHAAA